MGPVSGHSGGRSSSSSSSSLAIVCPSKTLASFPDNGGVASSVGGSVP
ncbi:MAG: hypothetical protein ACR2IS_08360 [Nitrososphaeraceae archaeon]